MFLVTFHGDIKNAWAYDDNGNLKAEGVLDKDGDQLRGIYLEQASPGAAQYLYVADGSKDSSEVYCYRGAGTSYERVSTFISPDDEEAMLHPFAVAFDGHGNCWVSNQNTNVVAMFAVESDGQSAYHSSVGTYLTGLYPKIGKFLDGTVVASSRAPLPDAPQTEDVTAVPIKDGGLDVKIKNDKITHSVRDVVFYMFSNDSGNYPLLFVSDEPAGLVRLYQAATGTHILDSNQLGSPVHLLLAGDTIYVGDGNQVLSSPVPNFFDPKVNWAFNAVSLSPPLPGDQPVSGMAFDNSGNFHVAVRSTESGEVPQVWKYDSSFSNGAPWPATMPDNPEFLLHIPD
ncbi:MAG TPA: hypothetical protein VN256_22770 [Pyrinomonadaceae bacterium]|nr:hypothetical protein [Pyrinomonadaceae bacterium]